MLHFFASERNRGMLSVRPCLLLWATFGFTVVNGGIGAASTDGLCTDTRCGGAAKRCCEGSPALQKKSWCDGAVTCDSCCGWVSSSIPAEAAKWVSSLKLQKQAFGNFMTETYSSNITVDKLPPKFSGGARSLHGDIYNLFASNRSDSSLKQAGFPLHMLEGDETYHYYAGDGPLHLFEFQIETGTVRNVSIGASLPGRDVPQFTIPGGMWTGALLAPGTTWALTGAGTTPGFDPRDSHMLADNKTMVAEMHRRFPGFKALIDRLLAFNA